MSLKISDYLNNKDIQCSIEICRLKENGISKWVVITRLNLPDYLPFRSDTFETREEALEYYTTVILEALLSNLAGQIP